MHIYIYIYIYNQHKTAQECDPHEGDDERGPRRVENTATKPPNCYYYY